MVRTQTLTHINMFDLAKPTNMVRANYVLLEFEVNNDDNKRFRLLLSSLYYTIYYSLHYTILFITE